MQRSPAQHDRTSSSTSPSMSPSSPAEAGQGNEAGRGAAAAAPTSTTTTSTSSAAAKLDGVLYHFYTRTSAVIVLHRLRQDSDVADVQGRTSQDQAASGSEARDSQPRYFAPHSRQGSDTSLSSAGHKRTRWFSLELPDTDIFREELRIWRSPSSLLAAAASSSQSLSSAVPPLVIDVILDTSALNPNNMLVLNSPRQGRRIRVDARASAATSDSPSPTRKSIVLEQWRLTFVPAHPSNPPDLPTVYKRCTTHLRNHLSNVRALPAYSLYQRLSGASENYSSDSKTRLLKFGLRISIGDLPDSDAAEEIAVDQGLQSGFEEQPLTVTEGVDILQLEDVHTAIGSLQLTCRYRTEADFTVEDSETLGMNDIDLDENFFRPTVARHDSQSSAAKSSPNTSSSSSPSHPPTPLHSTASSAGQPQVTRRRSLLGAAPPSTPQSTVSSAGVSGPGGTLSSIPAGGLAQALSRSPAVTSQPSVFSTATSGRPVAGLSSLRRAGSLAATPSQIQNQAPAFLPSPSHTSLGSTPPSPAIAAALSADLAFLAHGRRPSNIERRRSSNLSVERNSPPSTLLGTSPSSANQPTSSIRNTSLRTPSYNTYGSLRSGSFSPSSPSPLAQHMYARDSSSLGPSASALSSSPSGSSLAQLSASASLRSVFQNYLPSSPGSGTASRSQSGLANSRIAPRSVSGPNRTPLGGSGQQQQGASSADDSHAMSRSPTVAPQMIKRYSSTFSYRSGRQFAGSLGTDSGSGSGGHALASGDADLGDGSGSLPYSRSWAARIEARQAYGSSVSGSLSRSTGRTTQSSAIVDDEIDDLVRMIDSRPSLGPAPRSGTIAEDNLSSEDSQLRADMIAEGDIERRRSNQPSPSSPIGGLANTATPSVRTNGATLSRSQVDQILSRMARSVVRNSASPGSNSASGSGGSGGVGSVGDPTAKDASPSGSSPAFSRYGPSTSAGGGSVQRASLLSTSHTAAPARSPSEPGSLSPHATRPLAPPPNAAFTSQRHRRDSSRLSFDIEEQDDDPANDETAGRLELHSADAEVGGGVGSSADRTGHGVGSATSGAIAQQHTEVSGGFPFGDTDYSARHFGAELSAARGGAGLARARGHPSSPSPGRVGFLSSTTTRGFSPRARGRRHHDGAAGSGESDDGNV